MPWRSPTLVTRRKRGRWVIALHKRDGGFIARAFYSGRLYFEVAGTSIEEATATAFNRTQSEDVS